eukprot:Sdes_comp20970_c0_seq1m19023
MGSYVSFFRKKPSYEELLETVDKNIQLQEARLKTLQIRERTYLYNFTLYSILFYLLGLALLYIFYLFNGSFSLKNNIPLTAAFFCVCFSIPPLLFQLRKLLVAYFTRVKRLQVDKIEFLKVEKKLKLEETKEKLPYNAAKGLIDRFDDEK